MAIEYSVLIKSKKLGEETLIRKLEGMGYTCNSVERLPKGISIDLNNEVGFIVYLTNTPKYPYNSWNSSFYNNEFIFIQTLRFRLLKEYDDLEKRYKVMLSIIFDLMKDKEAIFISNGDSELCLFKQDGGICLHNKSEIWNRQYFKDIITDKNVEYLR